MTCPSCVFRSRRSEVAGVAPPAKTRPAPSQAAGGVSVTAMLEGIQSKLITNRRAKPVLSSAGDNVYMVAEETGRIRWVQPSGERLPCDLCHVTRAVRSLTAGVPATQTSTFMLRTMYHRCY